jgi:hypothetical protein
MTEKDWQTTGLSHVFRRRHRASKPRKKKAQMESRPGATGEFPFGKLDNSDEGELTIGIDADIHGNVRLEFGKPVAWLAMPPAQAASFARLLLRFSTAIIAASAKQEG